MPDYFYFDQTNQKYGPIDEQQLRELAVAGIIKPNTPMETVEGHKGIAKQIPGLQFTKPSTSNPSVSNSAVPAWYASAAIICGIVCVVLSLVVLSWEYHLTHNLGLSISIFYPPGIFRLHRLLEITFVVGMFFGCRGMSTNKARIAKIGLFLCIIAFFIPSLFWILLDFYYVYC